MRPSLGYSNYYWIKKDREKQQKEEQPLVEPIAEPIVQEQPSEEIISEEEIKNEEPKETHIITSLMVLPKENDNADI